MTRAVTTCLLVLVLARGAAAEVTVRATLDPPQVHVGESATLSVDVDGAQSAAPPAIGRVDGLGIRYIGPSTRLSLVNGRMAASTSHRFSVTAAKPGSFAIGPISVDVDGKTHDAGSVTLQALPAGAPGQPAAAAGSQLRLVLAAAKSEVYLGERLPLTLTLYVGAARVADLQYPAIPGDGFALEKLPEPTQGREQTPQGTFQLVRFATALTALRSGPLTVGPATMALSQIVRGRGSDAFFQDFFGETRRPLELQSEALTLSVLPLPEADRPPDFSGAVGRFTFDVKAAPRELTAGDPVTITATIAGDGDLERLTPPAFVAGDTLRVYPVQASPAAKAGRGSQKTFEQVVIPQQAGAVTLPELRFSYFDAEARAYRTVAAPPIALTVRASTAAQASPQVIGAAPAPARPEALGRDIVFIKDSPGTLVAAGARRYRSPVFWTAQTLPLGAWVAAVLWDRRRRRLSGDVRWARFTRAGRQARRAIAAARAALRTGDAAVFYDAVARAISEYLSAKLDLPPGGVSPDTVGERLRQTRLSPTLIRDLEEFFATCERARFAPSADGSADMDRTLARADAIVRGLERERRLARPVAALWLLVAVTGLAQAATIAESPTTVFFRGNALYGEERYPEAARQYEQVRTAGVESGNLYYNLGNAYVKAGDVPRAILAYERARRLIPRDPDLHANLGYARSLVGETDDEPALARLLLPFAERATSDELLLGVSLAWTVLLLLLVLGRLVPAVQRRAASGAVAAAIVLAVLGASATYRLTALELPAYAVVVTPDESAVRFEPSATGTAHFQAKPGSVLRVLSEREGWAQVARGDGRRGWIERAAVETL